MKWVVRLAIAVMAVVGLTLVGVGAEKFALLICNMAHPFFVDMVEGAQAAAKLWNVDVAVFDGRNDPALQLSQMEDAIVAGYDAILLNPTDMLALVPGVEKANEAGIPVFTLDRDVIGGVRICYLGTDNIKAAEDGARALLAKLEAVNRPKPWRIVHLWGTPGASSAEERKTGVHNVLKPLEETKEVEIVADLTAYFDRAKGMKVMEDILATTTNIDAVIVGNDEMALGALEALKAAKLKVGEPDGVLIMGFDAIPDAVEAVKRGDFIGTVAQAPYLMGYWGVEAAARHLRVGWLPPTGTPIYKPTGALHIDTGGYVVTLQNVEEIVALVKTPRFLPPK